MSTGRFYVKQNGRTFLVEPISEHSLRNAAWGQTDTTNLPIGGAVHPDDSIITDANFKNIITLPPGVSPLGYIESLLEDKK
jgi:hypothetical protein